MFPVRDPLGGPSGSLVQPAEKVTRQSNGPCTAELRILAQCRLYRWAAPFALAGFLGATHALDLTRWLKNRGERYRLGLHSNDSHRCSWRLAGAPGPDRPSRPESRTPLAGARASMRRKRLPRSAFPSFLARYGRARILRGRTGRPTLWSMRSNLQNRGRSGPLRFRNRGRIGIHWRNAWTFLVRLGRRGALRMHRRQHPGCDLGRRLRWPRRG